MALLILLMLPGNKGQQHSEIKKQPFLISSKNKIVNISYNLKNEKKNDSVNLIFCGFYFNFK